MGSPTFAIPALRALMSMEYDITAVYTQPDRKTGRGQRLTACPVKQFALSQGLRIMQPETFKGLHEIELLRQMKPDIIVVAAYGQILPESVLEIPTHKCINLHPSLLPRYRGPSPIAAAILNGDNITGVTVMLIEKKLDSGPMLNQKEAVISDDDTAETLSERLAVLGADMLIETIPLWVAGRIQPAAQDESRATCTRMETKEDGRLDFHLPAEQLWRMVRAYFPWPGCYLEWKDMRLRLLKAVPIREDTKKKVGEVVELPRQAAARAAVQTGDGLLGLITVQPEGKREMSAADFIAGHRDFIGSVL